MRFPVDVAACGCALDDVSRAAGVDQGAEVGGRSRPDPGSGETSHFALPS